MDTPQLPSLSRADTRTSFQNELPAIRERMLLFDTARCGNPLSPFNGDSCLLCIDALFDTGRPLLLFFPGLVRPRIWIRAKVRLGRPFADGA